MKTKLSLGPFFTATTPELVQSQAVLPLNLQIEWAHADEASAIQLYRHRPSHAPERVRLEHVVFRARDLPCDMTCPEWQIVATPEETFLPLESLLVALYRSGDVSRSIFAVLRDLESLVPFHSSVRKPAAGKGLLVPPAEAHGFVLTTLLRDPGLIYADFGWKPRAQANPFHVCLATFRTTAAGLQDAGEWRPHGSVGVAQLLAAEFHRMVPGSPLASFTGDGRNYLASRISETP